jgi:hypothetical protein
VRQFKITLPVDLRAKLDAASATSGRTLAEEMRQRIEKSFQQEEDSVGVEPQLRELSTMIMLLTVFVHEQTGHKWMHHPGALCLFQQALMAYLQRLKVSPPPADEPASSPGEMLNGQPLIPSDNLDKIATGLEALAYFFLRGPDTDLIRKLKELNLPPVTDFMRGMQRVWKEKERKS